MNETKFSLSRKFFFTTFIIVTVASFSLYKAIMVTPPPVPPLLEQERYLQEGLSIEWLNTKAGKSWAAADDLRVKVIRENDAKQGWILLIWTLILGILLFLRNRNGQSRALKYIVIVICLLPALSLALGLLYGEQLGEAGLILVLPFVFFFIATPLIILTALKKDPEV